MTTEFSFEIKKHIATISENEGYTKELNLVSWKGKDPVYDLRTWKNSEAGKQPLKGITLNKAEFDAIKAVMARYGND